MATKSKVTPKRSTVRKDTAKKRRRKSLSELNAWIERNHDTLLEKARQNSVRLTGKSTFGSASRRKSA
jgi:hypothetical protein